MSRITHFKQQPMNIEFWDYYILCHLNSDGALALQRMEYWDGTKDEGNTHAEALNDAAISAGQFPTQDTSNWIYKSQDELQWELLGAAGEKRLTKIITFLVDELKYLGRRNNPLEGWDRKKQYELKVSLLQEHINYLSYIVSSFNLPMRHLRPVFYAIEILTSEGIFIEALSVEKVITKIEQIKNAPKIPHFLKGDLEKWEQLAVNQPARSFRTFAEWKAHMCGMHSAESRNGKRTNAECIPQNRGSNSIEDTYMTNREDTYEESADSDFAQSANADIPAGSSLSADEMIKQLQAQGYTVTPPAEESPPATDALENTVSVTPAQTSTPQEIKADGIALSPRAQVVYREWCKQPWFHGVNPELTPTVAKHCTKLTMYDPPPTADIMLKTRHWYETKYPDKKGKGWYLGNFVNAYPDYLSAQYEEKRELVASKPSKRLLTRDELKNIPIPV